MIWRGPLRCFFFFFLEREMYFLKLRFRPPGCLARDLRNLVAYLGFRSDLQQQSHLKLDVCFYLKKQRVISFDKR